jgi:hypothetical protein
MPQLLSRVVPPPQGITMQPDNASKQPELAALVAQAISVWSLVEFTLATALVDMLGARASPAIAMYGALTSSAAQVAALTAAAETALGEREHELFEALMFLYRPLARQRHKFAHWIWAYCEQAPDHLVLADPQKAIYTHAAIAEIRHKVQPSGRFEITLSEGWFCYAKTELEQIISSFSEILNLFRWFQHLVGPNRHPPKDAIYQFLTAQPRVLASLARLRERRKNAQLEPDSPPRQPDPS